LALVFGDELAEFVVGFVEVGVALVGVVEGGFDFVDVRLELLFLLDKLGLGADFGVKTGLERLEGARVVASMVYEENICKEIIFYNYLSENPG